MFAGIVLAAAALAATQDLEQFAKAHVPTGSELAHKPVAGTFGPPGRHIVLLHRPESDDAGEFRGTVFLNGERPQTLPPLDLIPNQFAIEVKAVFFDSAQLFILYGYHRNGSQADDSHACAVYRWRDTEFVRVPDVERKIVGLSTAAAVRQRLRLAVPTLKRPGEKKK
jgi:hypothetical protein